MMVLSGSCSRIIMPCYETESHTDKGAYSIRYVLFYDKREVYRNQGQVGLNHVINVDSYLNRRIRSGSDLCLVFRRLFIILVSAQRIHQNYNEIILIHEFSNDVAQLFKTGYILQLCQNKVACKFGIFRIISKLF